GVATKPIKIARIFVSATTPSITKPAIAIASAAPHACSIAGPATKKASVSMTIFGVGSKRADVSRTAVLIIAGKASTTVTAFHLAHNQILARSGRYNFIRYKPYTPV